MSRVSDRTLATKKVDRRKKWTDARRPPPSRFPHPKSKQHPHPTFASVENKNGRKRNAVGTRPGTTFLPLVLPTRRKPPLLLPCHGIGFQRKEFGDFSRAENRIRNPIRNSRKRGEISGIFGLVEIGFSKFIYVRQSCLVVQRSHGTNEERERVRERERATSLGVGGAVCVALSCLGKAAATTRHDCRT